MPEFRKAGLCLLGMLGASFVHSADQWADPMRPDTWQTTTSRSSPTFRLSAIFLSGDRRVAILNGYPLRVGDRLGEAELIEIDEDRVTLSLGGRSIVTKLNTGRSEK